MPTNPTRRVLVTLVLLVVVAAVVAAGGFWAGVEWADRRWVGDMNRVGLAMQRLDQDIKGGGGPPRDADYFLKLTDLTLETFDRRSVTYYVGPVARHSARIEFDDSGVKGLSIR